MKIFYEILNIKFVNLLGKKITNDQIQNLFYQKIKRRICFC